MRDYTPFIEHLDSSVDSDTLFECALQAHKANMSMFADEIGDIVYGFGESLFDPMSAKDDAQTGLLLRTLWNNYCVQGLKRNWETVEPECRHLIRMREDAHSDYMATTEYKERVA